MTKTVLGVVAALVVAGAGWYWYMGGQKGSEAADTSGVYAYACSNGVAFEMSLSPDISSMTLKAQGSAPFSEVVLKQKSGSTYATDEGEVIFVGSGEEVSLTVGAASLTCNPVPSQDMAPFNWGN